MNYGLILLNFVVLTGLFAQKPGKYMGRTPPLMDTGITQRVQTVPGDPMGVRHYTLRNGLQVFLTVNKQTPRIQTMIAVRAGSKNDPSDNTGLAHYQIGRAHV